MRAALYIRVSTADLTDPGAWQIGSEQDRSSVPLYYL